MKKEMNKKENIVNMIQDRTSSLSRDNHASKNRSNLLSKTSPRITSLGDNNKK